MSLKLNNVGLNRKSKPRLLYVNLQNEKGEAVNVHVEIEDHTDIEALTLAQIEHLAHEAAKRLHP